MMASPGDHVKIITKDKSIEGVLMPTPELTDKGTIILKLKNGYNIGISEDKIQRIDLIKKYSETKISVSSLKTKKGLPTVSVLSTGGTISSKVDYRTGAVYADYTAEDFISMCPEIKDIANIKAKKIMSLMSEDMVPKDWINIARSIAEEVKKGVDGIVITQGTDTLHYTAAALSFLLEKINIPIVITGSQRSIDRGSSDAFMNLVCSVKAAAYCDCAEVMTCLHGSMEDDYCLLIRGTKVRKMHTSRRDAFRPINSLPIAKVYPDKDIEMIGKCLNNRNTDQKKIVGLKDSFEEKVALITVFPNMDPEIMDFYINKGYKGIVLAATALGHVPTWTERSLIPYIKKAEKKGIPIFIATQTLYGSVNPYVYTNLRKVSIEAKGIYLDDILPEVAYIKAGWVLSQERDIDKVKIMMKKNIKGEFNSSLAPEMFLN